MKRKLASIQTVTALEPIKNADRIELAKVLGWNAVVHKGEFAVGDKCVFFEIDSVLPSDASWAQFLQDHSYRVSTMKFRGVISQGLALPLDILVGCGAVGYSQEGIGTLHSLAAVTGFCCIGDDVTAALGVTLHELPDDSYVDGAKASPFPAGIPRSHAARLQSCPEVLDELHGVVFVMTMKCDGKSATFLKRDGELIVASHKCAMARVDNMFWQMAEKYDLANVLSEGTAVQGEICGPGIAKNRMQLAEKQLFVFDVFSVSQARYLDYRDMVCFCEDLGLDTVPEVEVASFDPSLEWFLGQAQGTYPGTNTQREGIVVKPLEEMVSEALGMGRLQFKVHSVKYLLKSEKKRKK